MFKDRLFFKCIYLKQQPSALQMCFGIWVEMWQEMFTALYILQLNLL